MQRINTGHNDEQIKMKDARTSKEYDRIWKNTGKCVFCDLKDKYIIHEENDIVLTVSLYPYIDGNIMAIPRNHIKSPKELTPEQWETIRKFNYVTKKLIKKIYGHKGLWTLIREGGTYAQMTVVDHLHIQFIPFDSPDLCHWNYRKIKNTAIENQALFAKSRSDLVKYLNKFENKYSKKK